MRFTHIFSLTFTLFTCAIAPCTSQAADAPANNFQVKPWAVGQSITLQTKLLKQNGDIVREDTIVFSIVGKETIKRKDYFWIEIETQLKDGPTQVEKLLVRQPSSIDFEKALKNPENYLRGRRIIRTTFSKSKYRKSPSIFEFEVSKDIVKKIENSSASSETSESSNEFTVTSDKSIKTQAGTFTTSRFHYEISNKGSASSEKKPYSSNSSDYWGSSDVPIWGIVKEATEEKQNDGSVYKKQVELVSYKETGAISKITGKPMFVSLKQEDKILNRFPKPNADNSSEQTAP